jgi:hypothetical protein
LRSRKKKVRRNSKSLILKTIPRVIIKPHFNKSCSLRSSANPIKSQSHSSDTWTTPNRMRMATMAASRMMATRTMRVVVTMMMTRTTKMARIWMTKIMRVK